MEEVIEFLRGYGFTAHIKSADGNYIHFTNLDCRAGISFINDKGTLRFKVAGFLPASMVTVCTDYMDWANREALLWKCVKEVHQAVNLYEKANGSSGT